VKDLEGFRKDLETLVASGKEKVLGRILESGRTKKMVVFDQSALVKEEEAPGDKEAGEDAGGGGDEGEEY
jgi:hypothetical protein